MIRALDLRSAETGVYSEGLSHYDFIINTVPAMVLPAAPGTALKIDLASQPGIGGCGVLQARGLPGLLAPESSGALIAKLVSHWLKEK